MTSTPSRGLIVYAPEWFQRQDFWEFVCKHLNPARGVSRIASWHADPLQPPHQNSDVFITVDGRELSETGYLPPDIEIALLEELLKSGMCYGVIWIQNQRPPEGIF